MKFKNVNTQTQTEYLLMLPSNLFLAEGFVHMGIKSHTGQLK